MVRGLFGISTLIIWNEGRSLFLIIYDADDYNEMEKSLWLDDKKEHGEQLTKLSIIEIDDSLYSLFWISYKLLQLRCSSLWRSG